MDPNLHTPLMSSSSSLYLNDYKLDKPNTALCICTLTGATYARRHWKQSKGSEHPLRHKAMAIVELIPVIGGIAAGIENQVSKKGQRPPTSSARPSVIEAAARRSQVLPSLPAPQPLPPVQTPIPDQQLLIPPMMQGPMRSSSSDSRRAAHLATIARYADYKNFVKSKDVNYFDFDPAKPGSQLYLYKNPNGVNREVSCSPGASVGHLLAHIHVEDGQPPLHESQIPMIMHEGPEELAASDNISRLKQPITVVYFKSPLHLLHKVKIRNES